MVPREFSKNKPVIKYLIIHHSAGGTLENLNDKSLKRGFSDVGFDKGYRPYGYDKETGYTDQYGGIQTQLRDPITGKFTYSMYHYVIHSYAIDNNPYGYRIVQMVENPLKYDVGSTGTDPYNYNKYGIAVCFAGNYMNDYINEDALKCAGEKLKWLWYYTNGELEIIPHKNIDATICPGRIASQLDVLKKYLEG
jgi:hypothetical protein